MKPAGRDPVASPADRRGRGPALWQGFAIAVGLALAIPCPGAATVAAPFADRLAWADSLFLRQQPQAALSLLDSLLGSSAAGAGIVDIQLARGRLLATIGQGRPAEAALRVALAALPVEADSLRWAKIQRWLTVALDLQGHRAEVRRLAESSLASALRRADIPHEAYARLALAYADLQAGDLLAAQRGYRHSLALFERLGNRRYLLIALTGLGRCHNGAGELAEAAACYARVAAESRALGDPFSEGHALNNLGTLSYALGDPAAAVKAFQRASELQRANGNPEGCIIPARNIAAALTALGRLEDAAGVLAEALVLCEAQGYAVHRAMLLEQLGIVRGQQGRWGEAAALLRASVTPAAACSPDQLAASSTRLASVLAELDSSAAGLALLADRVEPLRARLSADAALQLDRVWGELLLGVERPREALRHFGRAESLAARLAMDSERLAPLAQAGRCYRRLAVPDSALALLSRAEQVWESARARSQDPQWRERSGDDARQLFADLAQLLLAHPPERPAAERRRVAFDLLQRYKARTLRERMLGPGSPIAGADAAPATVTLAHLQEEVLQPGELLLDAFFGPDSLLIFAVDRGECRVLSVGLGGEALESRLRRLHALLSQAPNETDYGLVETACRSLGSQLFTGCSDLLRQNGRLLFSPDGVLNLIPLGALAVDDEPPLLTTHEIQTLPSASLLADLRASPAEPARRRGSRLLAIAGRQPDAGSPFPGAAAEVRWLRWRYRGVEARTADIHQALDLQDLKRYELLHFATHTKLDDQHPWRSVLLLAGATASDSGAVLQAAQIAEVHLTARLAVLTGCESAGGTIVSGEGVLGLTSAFLAAGVPAVVASLWPVSDAVMPRFTRVFYSELERGASASAALRLAQLAIAGDTRTRPPCYWAGFLLVGEGGSGLQLDRGPTRWLSWAAVGLGLLALWGCLGGGRRKAGLGRWGTR